MNDDFLQCLERLFRAHATEKAPLMSVRSRAQFLGVSAPQLSRLINGRVPLTDKMARMFSKKLAIKPEDEDQIFQDLKLCAGDTSDDRFEAVMAAIRLQISIDPDGVPTFRF